MKKFLSILGILAAIVVVIGVAVYINMGSLVKYAAETVATDALEVPVNIGQVDVNLEEMTVGVSDIKIGNPKGFKNKNAIHIASLDIKARSMTREILLFSSIDVGKTDIFLEVGENGTNLGTIHKTVSSKGNSQSQPANNSGDAAQVKVIIDSFLMRQASITPAVTLTDKDLGTITMPDLQLTGIGEKSNGVLAREAIADILQKVTHVAVDTSFKSGFLEGLSGSAMQDLRNRMGIKGSLQKAVDGVKSDAQDLGNKVKEGVKSIFQ